MSPATLPERWIHGTAPGAKRTDPPLQVHRASADTVVMRQSKADTFEAPFLFLLFGSRRALLLDTGAVKDPNTMPLRATVDGLVAEWLSDHPCDGYELVVAHTHGHGDHVAGDALLADRPATTVVPREVEAVRSFFGFEEWPGAVTFELGDRDLDMVAIPGHHRASIAIYDPSTQWLLTGDTVYPGRLYVEDTPAFRDSLDRLVELTHTRDVAGVVGTHIEMTTTAGVDYPIGTRYQPSEPPLLMSVAQLERTRQRAHDIGDAKGAHVFDDVAIWVGPCVGPMLRQVARRMWASARRR